MTCRQPTIISARCVDNNGATSMLLMTAFSACVGRASLLLIVLLLALAPTGVKADCSFNGRGRSAAGVNFTLPGKITLPLDLAVGAMLYQSPPVAANNPPKISCDTYTAYGVQNSVGATPASATTIYPTGITGLGYRLVQTRNASSLRSYGRATGPGRDNSPFSTALMLQLIQTGPIASGEKMPAGQLGYWQSGSLKTAIFGLANAVTFVAPACAVVTTPINVVLPSVSTTALASANATTGTTPFSIDLNCPGGTTSKFSIRLKSNKKDSYPGTIKNAGTAKGVDVQLIDQDFNPVTFLKKIAVSTTPAGKLSLPYYARYYRTPAAISAGTVAASATFTLIYK